MKNSTVTARKSNNLLPDLPETVHGIKSLAPNWAVQCDDCLTIHEGEWLLMVAKTAVFNNRSETPELRLCSGCWANRGWTEDYYGWKKKA